MSTVAVDFAMEGEGQPVYMIHGIGSRKVTWSGLIPHLMDEFTCVTFDLRGHGQSPVPAIPYTLDDLVQDLEALRARMGHDKIHVIGHSLGGMIGPAYARAYPDRALSICLLSTAAGRTAEDRAELAAVRTAMDEKGIEPVLDTLVQRWYTDEFIDKRPDAIQNRIKQVLDTPPDVFKDVFRIYAETEMGPWLHELMCPCLVLTGEHDGGSNPRLNRFIANELQNAELIILERLKHSILIEDPDRVAIPVKDFLLRHRLEN